MSDRTSDVPDRVKVRCPLCPWESDEIIVRDVPNGVWLAFNEAGKDWHPHFLNAHKPAPERVLIFEQGDDKVLHSRPVGSFDPDTDTPA